MSANPPNQPSPLTREAAAEGDVIAQEAVEEYDTAQREQVRAETAQRYGVAEGDVRVRRRGGEYVAGLTQAARQERIAEARESARQDLLEQVGEDFTAEDITVERTDEGFTAQLSEAAVERERAEAREQAETQLLEQLGSGYGPEDVTVKETDSGFEATLTESAREQVEQEAEAEARSEAISNLLSNTEGFSRSDVTVQETDQGFRARVTESAQRRELREDILSQTEEFTAEDVVFQDTDDGITAQIAESAQRAALREDILSEYPQYSAEDITFSDTEDGLQADVSEQAQRRELREDVLGRLAYNDLQERGELPGDGELSGDPGREDGTSGDVDRDPVQAEYEGERTFEQLSERVQEALAGASEFGAQDVTVEETDDGLQAGLTEEAQREQLAEQIIEESEFGYTREDITFSETEEGELRGQVEESAVERELRERFWASGKGASFLGFSGGNQFLTEAEGDRIWSDVEAGEYDPAELPEDVEEAVAKSVRRQSELPSEYDQGFESPSDLLTVEETDDGQYQIDYDPDKIGGSGEDHSPPNRITGSERERYTERIIEQTEYDDPSEFELAKRDGEVYYGPAEETGGGGQESVTVGQPENVGLAVSQQYDEAAAALNRITSATGGPPDARTETEALAASQEMDEAVGRLNRRIAGQREEAVESATYEEFGDADITMFGEREAGTAAQEIRRRARGETQLMTDAEGATTVEETLRGLSQGYTETVRGATAEGTFLGESAVAEGLEAAGYEQAAEQVETTGRNVLRGAAELGNVPALGVTAVELGEYGAYAAGEVSEGQAQELATQTYDEAVERGQAVAEYAQTNPAQFGGMLAGSLAGSTAIMSAAGRVSSTAGAVSRYAIQPGEEVLGTAGYRATRAVRGETSAQRLFPNREPLIFSEEAALRAARGVSSRVRGATRGNVELQGTARQQALIDRFRPQGSAEATVGQVETTGTAETGTLADRTTGVEAEATETETVGVTGATSERLGTVDESTLTALYGEAPSVDTRTVVTESDTPGQAFPVTAETDLSFDVTTRAGAGLVPPEVEVETQRRVRPQTGSEFEEQTGSFDDVRQDALTQYQDYLGSQARTELEARREQFADVGRYETETEAEERLRRAERAEVTTGRTEVDSRFNLRTDPLFNTGTGGGQMATAVDEPQVDPGRLSPLKLDDTPVDTSLGDGPADVSLFTETDVTGATDTGIRGRPRVGERPDVRLDTRARTRERSALDSILEPRSAFEAPQEVEARAETEAEQEAETETEFRTEGRLRFEIGRKRSDGDEDDTTPMFGVAGGRVDILTGFRNPITGEEL